MKNEVVTTETGKFDLNGLPISLRGSTSYKDVFFGQVSWNKTCYVALAGLNEDEAKLVGTKTFIWHLSYHDSALDAAYVAMKFNQNRKENLKKLANTKTGEWQCEIPEFKYVAIDSAEMVEKRAEIVFKSIKQQVEKKEKDVIAREGINKKYGFQILKELATKFGRDSVMNALDKLTTKEFELNFGLTK